jgi:predicted transcriptional regulator
MGQDIEKDFMGQFDAFQEVEVKGDSPMACEKKQGEKSEVHRAHVYRDVQRQRDMVLKNGCV